MAIKFDESKGVWRAYVCKRDPLTKKPITRAKDGLKTKTEAQRTERKLRDELVLILDRKLKEAKEPRWQQHLENYFLETEKRDISRKTVENMRLCLRAHTLVSWGDRLISDISKSDITDLIRSKVELSESHRKNILKFIRGCFQYAVDTRVVLANPTPKLYFRLGDKIKTSLTQEEANKLLSFARKTDHEWYPIWAMALYTGMRNGELYALTWDKINLEQKRALVDCSWTSKDGFKNSTKSGNDRNVVLATDLVEILKELKLKSFDRHFVLPRIDRWDKGEQARELRRVLEGLGLPRIRFHDLRATWATIMLNRGIPPIQVMSMGGWIDLKTMQRYIRKAGVDINGITDGFSLHNLTSEAAVLKMI